jgi:hypothetical protein
MDMKHTPGPWQFDAQDDAHVVSDDYHVIRAGCGYLAEAKEEREPGFRIAGHMTEADARLIAAAPDLLAALQSILPDAVGNHIGGPDTQVRIDSARAAIAKATRGAA